jgi:hypothetical protein
LVRLCLLRIQIGQEFIADVNAVVSDIGLHKKNGARDVLCGSMRTWTLKRTSELPHAADRSPGYRMKCKSFCRKHLFTRNLNKNIFERKVPMLWAVREPGAGLCVSLFDLQWGSSRPNVRLQ